MTNLNDARIEEIFTEIESDEKLAEFRIGNELLWVILRPSLYFLMGQHFYNTHFKIPAISDNRLSVAKRYSRVALRTIANYRHFKTTINSISRQNEKPICLAMSIGHLKYKLPSGKIEHPVWDALFKRVENFQPLILEMDFNYSKETNGTLNITCADILNLPSINTLFQNLIQNNGVFNSLYNLKLPCFEKHNLKNLWEEFCLCGIAKRKVFMYFTQYSRALNLFKKLRPSCIVLRGIMWYGLIRAAKKFNIPVIEFQHGETNRYDPLYNWPRWSFQYMNELPSPNHVLTFGTYWTGEISKGNVPPNVQLHSLGSIPLDTFRKQSENQRHLKDNDVIKLLYTTGLPMEFELHFWSNLIELVKSNGLPFQLVIKCHPKLTPKQVDFYKSLEQKYLDNVKVYKHGEISVLELLSQSTIHCSDASTCHYESIALGVPSAVLKFARWILVEDLIKMNAVREAENIESLYLLINSAHCKNDEWRAWVEITEHHKFSFFEKDAAEKAAHFLDNGLR